MTRRTTTHFPISSSSFRTAASLAAAAAGAVVFSACGSIFQRSDTASMNPAAQTIGASQATIGNGQDARSAGWFARWFGGEKSVFSRSGSLVLSYQLPERPAQIAGGASQSTMVVESGGSPSFAPLIGYFPPKLSKLPADNELWLELDRSEQRLRVFQGKEKLDEVAVDLGPDSERQISSGQYLVQSKQKSPRWYAPDAYFRERGIAVPSSTDETRFLKGAFGAEALFLNETLAIHSSPVWTSEIGGIRVDHTVLTKLFEQAPIGVSLVIR